MKLAQNLTLPDGTVVTGPLDPNRFSNLASVVNAALPFVFSIAGIILLAFLILGGYDFLLSAGDAKKAEVGKKRITNALLGFVIIFAAYWLVQIVDYIFKLGVYTP